MSDDDGSAGAHSKPVSRIRNKLAALSGLPERVRDGVADRMAGGRLLPVGPVVAEGDIALFEAELGDRLPVSYRRLLSGVGDGPFGPGFEMRCVAARPPSRTFAIGPRVFRLEHYDTVEEHADQPWVVAASLGELRAACIDGELRALELADYGCGMSAVVVLRGPARGEVWLPGRACRRSAPAPHTAGLTTDAPAAPGRCRCVRVLAAGCREADDGNEAAGHRTCGRAGRPRRTGDAAACG